MNQLMWRLHNRQAYWALGALAVLAVVLVITGNNMASQYHSFEATCAATQSCGSASRLFTGDQLIINLVDLTLVIPALFGVFWGAPLLAKEFEEGTQNLAWTQGVTRRKWFGVNLAWVFTAAALWAGVLTIVVSWWRSPENAIESRFNPGHFDIQGIVPIAYAIFAVALGIAVGALVRRVLPAIAITIGGFVVVRLAIMYWARPHFLPAVTKIFPLGSKASGLNGAWVISTQNVGPNGTSLGAAFPPPQQCSGGGKSAAGLQCMGAHGYHQLLTYQPAGRFWAFQGTEAAIFVALAAVVVVIAYRLVLKRDA